MGCVYLAACSGGSGGGGGIQPPPPATYTVGGTVTGLLSGNSITLTDNGTDNLTVKADGTFTFTTRLTSGASFNATLAATTPTVQPCSSLYGAGTVNSANVKQIYVFCGEAGGTGTLNNTDSMNIPRLSHDATLLPSGKVLVNGGQSIANGAAINSAELYDPTL
jgi:hypothetical protein